MSSRKQLVEVVFTDGSFEDLVISDKVDRFWVIYNLLELLNIPEWIFQVYFD